MKTRDFYAEETEFFANDVHERYGVQSGRDGKKFVYDPFPTKEEYLDSFMSALDDPYEELDDYDDLSREEDEKLVEEAKKVVAEAYDRVAKERAEFLADEEE